MLEIYLLIIGLLIPLGLAKRKGKGRRFRRYIRGNFTMDLAMTGLAGNTIVTEDMGDAVQDSTWVTSVEATYSISGWTPDSGVGPFNVYIAHSDYTDTEIEQWIENATNWDFSNMIAQEIGRRKIRRVGMIYATGGVTVNDSMSLNDGRIQKTKIGWMLPPNGTLQIGVYNTGSGAVATTTPTLQVDGHVNLWPQ